MFNVEFSYRDLGPNAKSSVINITVWNFKGSNPHHNRAGKIAKYFMLSMLCYGKLVRGTEDRLTFFKDSLVTGANISDWLYTYSIEK